MEIISGIPVIGFYGFSHSGKTSLIYKIVQTLQKANIRAGVIKRTDKAVSSEPPGKDTAGYRAAGAKLTAFLSASETSFVVPAPLDIPKIIGVMDNLTKVDLIIIEGSVHPDVPKIRLGDIPIRENTLFSYEGDFSGCIQTLQKMLDEKRKEKNEN